MIELQSGVPVAPSPLSSTRKLPLGQKRPTWWLWGNILSLDAPIVAVLWHLLLAKTFALKADWASPAALGFAVWVIYLIDHLLDTRGMAAAQPEPARKIFFRNHWHLMVGIAAGGLILTVTFARIFLSRTLFGAGILGGIAVGLYFGSVHLLPTRIRLVWPREAVVALLFSFGICLPVWLNAGTRAPQILVYALPFFLLCWLNCCAVELWDWQAAGKRFEDQPNFTAKWIAEHLAFSACLILVLGISLAGLGKLHLTYVAALVLSALSFAAIARLRTHSPASRCGVALRCVLIDLALCWPLPILAALRLPAAASFWS